MPVKFNHTIVPARDRRAAAESLSELLGVAAPQPYGPFMGVHLANDVALDFIDDDTDFSPRHYAFLVTEPEFDRIFAKIQQRNTPYWADPARKHPGEINTRDGGRGVYFNNPDGHLLELLTRPYGSGD